MTVIAGVNLPDNKQVEYSLRALYGIGPTLAKRIADEVGVPGGAKLRDLSDAQLAKVREAVGRRRVEGELRRMVQMGIRRKIEIRSYQGLRHSSGLPVRGQRTRTNSRTRKGPRKTVAGRRAAGTRK
ncbi:MAG: 30S ribosomal protein S13 [Chloroflexi bacterium]|nr:30S ribosomal protein S13 [Chloroflexota bacterium]